MHWHRLVGWALALAWVAGGGSLGAPPAVLEAAEPGSGLRARRTPVIFVPGVTGVRLRNEDTGRMVWGTGRALMTPHDRGHGVALTVTSAAAGPRLTAAGAVLDLRLFGIVRYRVYQKLVNRFTEEGYRWGDLEDPDPADDFFLFSYDWRQDNVRSAQRLARQLEELRRLRGVTRLSVNLVCQSNGAHICRYFTKYGGLDLGQAEVAADRSPAATTVQRLILVGASNGGSIRVLRELHRGRRYIDLIGRFWSPETLFTFRSLYQDLPAYARDLFVDEQGRVLDVDLFDPQTWRRYQWSVFGEGPSRRLERPDAPAWLGSDRERLTYLAEVLERARRFHRVLQADPPTFGATEYSLLAADDRETSRRAVLARRQGRWELWFGDDRQVRQRDHLRSVVTTLGDGHATAASQRWLSAGELARLGERVIPVVGTHRGMILEEPVQSAILQILSGRTPGDR